MTPALPVILVVEDDDGIGGGLLRALRGEGYDPRWARDGRDALSEPLTDVDLVLLDVGESEIEQHQVDVGEGLAERVASVSGPTRVVAFSAQCS